MKWADRHTWKRLLIGSIALLVAGTTGSQYMFRCHGRAAPVMTTPDIPADQLKAHVRALAHDIGERNLELPGKLDAAANYIEHTWKSQGYTVVRHPYRTGAHTCFNLEITLTGSTRSGEIILLGAHYDSPPSSPGANDNASGVASLLELSRVFAGKPQARTLRFVSFVNEEPPYFQTDQMGSRVYARMARQRGDDIRVMFALETMGYYSNEPGSQQYPPLFKWFYPDRGNFIGFISNIQSRPQLCQAVRAFRAHSDFPAQSCATWSRLPGIGWSDHHSFWMEGYPAIMITDTAPFRYEHYHTVLDTPDKLNYDLLARVTAGLTGMITALANQP